MGIPADQDPAACVRRAITALAPPFARGSATTHVCRTGKSLFGLDASGSDDRSFGYSRVSQCLWQREMTVFKYNTGYLPLQIGLELAASLNARSKAIAYLGPVAV